VLDFPSRRESTTMIAGDSEHRTMVGSRGNPPHGRRCPHFYCSARSLQWIAGSFDGATEKIPYNGIGAFMPSFKNAWLTAGRLGR